MCARGLRIGHYSVIRKSEGEATRAGWDSEASLRSLPRGRGEGAETCTAWIMDGIGREEALRGLSQLVLEDEEKGR